MEILSQTKMKQTKVNRIEYKLDRNNVRLNCDADNDNQQNDGNNEERSGYVPDEHVAAVWMDEKENVLSWFLGVIDSISPDTIDIKYYHRRDKKGFCWTFPEDDSIPLATPRDHIIFGDITVSYMQTTVIRCAIDRNTIMDIKTAFETYISNLA